MTRHLLALLLLMPLSLVAQSPDSALPEPAALIAKVGANQKQIQQLRRDYICREIDETDELNKDGNSQKHNVYEYEFFWRNGVQVRQLVARNGKPVSPDESRKEQEKTDKAIREYRERREGDGGSPNHIGIDTFLRASTFSHSRRETFHDRPVIAMDVSPNPSFHPSTDGERIVHSLEGTVWIDEQAAQVVRLEAHLAKSYKVAGGLAASIHEGSGAVLEQQHINGEVWMPALVDIHIQARVLLFAGVRQHIVQRFTDYRKFRTESHIISVEEAPDGSAK